MIAVRHGDTSVCLLVDQVDGLHDVTSTDLEPPPPIIAGLDARWLDYVARSTTGQLVGVLNVDRVLSRVALAGKEVDPANV